jgi:hypothetical protein
MNLSLTITLKVADVLTDADALPVVTSVSPAVTATVARVSTGVYAITLADVAAGTAYTVLGAMTVDGRTYAWKKTQTASAVGESPDAYQTVAAAEVLAAGLPGMTAWKNLGGDAQATVKKAAALLLASFDIDSIRLQGRKYDSAQIREFPRIDGSLLPTTNYPLSTHGLEARATVWDFDPSTNTAVVPHQVKMAVLFQADSILAGDRDSRLQAIADGLASQSVGSLSESYQAAVVAGGVNPLCERAARLMGKYRLRSGALL